MSDSRVRRISVDVADCPRCGRSHKFFVRVRLPAKTDNAVPVFGGAGTPQTTATLAFNCPCTTELITVPVPSPPDGEIVGPDDGSEVIPEIGASEEATVVGVEAEYAEWIKASRGTAIDFCKSMLTSATGAIPVYFALMKYIGVEAINGTSSSRIGIIPPLLFLISAAIFAVAQRPRLQSVRQADFAHFRTSRLRELHRFMLLGLIVFAAGIVVAIGLAGRLIRP